MSQEWAGGLMGAAFAGVLIIQVPVGWLADRLGKLPILLGCYGFLVAGLIFVPGCTTTAGIGSWLFVLGASTGALYPLGLSLLSDRVSPTILVRAYSWYLALDCIGSVMGGLAMGQACKLWGESALFGTGLVAIGLVLGAAVVMRLKAWRIEHRKEPEGVHYPTAYGARLAGKNVLQSVTSAPVYAVPVEQR